MKNKTIVYKNGKEELNLDFEIIEKSKINDNFLVLKVPFIFTYEEMEDIKNVLSNFIDPNKIVLLQDLVEIEYFSIEQLQLLRDNIESLITLKKLE